MWNIHVILKAKSSCILEANIDLKLILPLAVQVNNNLQSVCFLLCQFVLSGRNKMAMVFFLFLSKTSKFYDFLKLVCVYLIP